MSQSINALTMMGEMCWAIWPPAGEELAGRRHIVPVFKHEIVNWPEWPETTMVSMPDGHCFSGEGFGEEFAARMARLPKTVDKIAVIPVRGVITQRSSFHGTTTESLDRQLASAMANPEVGVIVYDHDSPGGSVLGTPEHADNIRAANQIKPVVAVANSMAASGDYWLASAAGQLVVAPSGQVGSIGVFAMHTDASKMLDDMGIKITFVHAGKFKVEGNPTEPLGDEARGSMQERIDTYYDMFVGAVAAGRGVTKADVLKNFGQGRMFTAEAARAAGMVDRVATLDEVLGGMVKQDPGTPRRDRAERRARVIQNPS